MAWHQKNRTYMKLKVRIFLFFFAVVTDCAFAQNTVKITEDYGSDNSEIQQLMDFDNIYIEKLHFESENLKGKFCKIDLEEYKDGKLAGTTTLFDGSELDYFKIGTNRDSLTILSKLSDGQLKICIKGKKFSTKKFYFKLISEADTYVLKSFFGAKKELNVDMLRQNAILAITPPSVHADGSGSYCEVVQSGVAPEKIGEKFRLSQYFLIKVSFK